MELNLDSWMDVIEYVAHKRAQGQLVNITQVANDLKRTYSNTHQVVKLLERKSLIVTTRAGRSFNIEITRNGMSAGEAIQALKKTIGA